MGCPMLTEVRLYGSLGKRFGRVHKFDIETPAEAMRALFANCKGMKEWFADRQKSGFRVYVGEKSKTAASIGADELGITHTGKTISITPAVGGAKAGFGQVILGVVLIVVGVIINYYTGGTAGNFFISMGVSLVIGGISRMLFTPPDTQNNKPTDTPNYTFSGPVNTVSQGHPVPVGYGRLRVGGAVISAGIRSEDYATGGGGGGFGGGGGCPTLDTLIDLTATSQIQAEHLKPGMMVYTQHQDTLLWDFYSVESIGFHRAECYKLILEDGRKLVATWNHRVLLGDPTLGLTRWEELHKLQAGDIVLGRESGVVKSSEYDGEHLVARIMVEGARTYQASGFTSHNIKQFQNVDG
jgi:predicted phage tail protein